MAGLTRGSVVWADFDPVRGREQSGARPALVVCSVDYIATISDLLLVVPITTADRGWPHHVPLEGDELRLTRPSFAMTEQPRVLDRERLRRDAGRVSKATLDRIDPWLAMFFGLVN